MGREKIHGCVVSDVGLVRKNNEDNYLLGHVINGDSKNYSEASAVFDFDKCFCMGVFDGMGGLEDGEAASFAAATVFQELSFELEMLPYERNIYEKLDDKLKETFIKANACVKQLHTDGGINGTTGTIIVGCDNRFKMFHVGDSRVYVLRDGNLYLLSSDHTLAQMKLSLGIYRTIDDVPEKEKHQLTNFIGIDDRELVTCESEWLELKDGDKVLICSDGLYDMCNDKLILNILNSNCNITDITKDLINSAKENGGNDNVTVMIMEKICH